MKLIKDTETSLLLKAFLLNNQDYLSISVLYYFDLSEPEIPLAEQEMLKESSKLLGETLLDYAMPKPKAEVLLSGFCHNPLKHEGSSHVSLRVAEMHRELYIFGEREYRAGSITKPLPFKTMPLDIPHAIGIDENHPPHIEDPKSLRASSYDSIEPASFMPQDMFSKTNMKKLGTYDEKWKRELWPGFASDMDYSFFNLAQKQQQQEKFFEGGESIELLNMHPKYHKISSYIPKTFIRCLVTKPHKDKEDELTEVKLQRDTLWLFPEIQRGIVIFRATMPIADEIYSDIKSINLKSVKPNEPVKSLEELFELQKKELTRDVEFDETPLKDLDTKITQADKELFDIPRQTRESLEKSQGKRPTFVKTKSVSQEPDEMELAILLEIQKIKDNPDISDEIKAQLDKNPLEEKVKTWNDYAFEFVCDSVVGLKKEPNELEKLKQLGFAKRTIARSWVGFNNEFKTIQGMELPKGVVTARFFEATLKSLRVDGNLVVGSDEVYELFLSEGNYSLPLFYLRDDLEAHLCDQEAFDICNTLVCDDILAVGDAAKEALASAYVVFYLQEDGVIDKLPNARKFDCGNSKNLFELHQNGVEIREQIVENLSNDIKETLPIERDISAKAIDAKIRAIKKKAKLEDEALEKEMQIQLDEAIAKSDDVLRELGIDSANPVDDSLNTSKIIEDLDKAIAELEKTEQTPDIDVKDMIEELQKIKEELKTIIEDEEKEKIEDEEQDAKVKKEMQEPENPNAKLTREKVIELHRDAKSFSAKDLSELDLSELDLSGIDLTQTNLSKTNFTNSNLSGAKLDQANCMQTNFTKANLSDAKASAIVFNKSILEHTLFYGFEAEYGYFSSLVFEKCNFTEAVLDEANFEDVDIQSSSFESCSFVNASFSKTKIRKSSFDNSKMTKVSFSDSSMYDCELLHLESKGMSFNKTKVVNCSFSDSKLYNMRILKGSLFSKCDMSRCDMDKSTIFEVSLDECSFYRSTLERVLVKKTSLSRCDFTGAIAKEGRFEFSTASECLFVGINLFKGSLRRMNLKRCDFSHSNLYSVEMYKLKVFEVKFDGANLKRSNLEDRVELIDDK